MTTGAVLSHQGRRTRQQIWVTRTLISLELVIGLTALACGPLLILTDGLGMNRVELDGTPFSSFVVPGLVLGAVVGGSLLVGGVALWKQAHWGPMLALFAGCVLLGWILAEIAWIDAGRGLQSVILVGALIAVSLAGHVVRTNLWY